MTKRSDIAPTAGGWRAVSYTRRCGWVDWGHALPGGAIALLRQVFTESGNGAALANSRVTLEASPAFVLTFGETMRKFGQIAGTYHHWVVKKGNYISDVTGGRCWKKREGSAFRLAVR